MTRLDGELILLAVAAWSSLACGGAATVSQSVQRGQPSVREERAPNGFRATSEVSSQGVAVQVEAAQCVKVTETPLKTTTTTTRSPKYGSPIGFFAAGAGVGALGGYGLSAASDRPETCPVSNSDCTTRKETQGASIGLLALGGAFLAAGTYFLIKAEGSVEEKEEASFDRQQSAPYACSSLAGVPVELRAGGRVFAGLTDGSGRAFIALPANAGWLGTSAEGLLFVHGQKSGVASLAAYRTTRDAEPSTRPGPVMVLGSPYTPGSVLVDGQPILVDWDGSWYDARALGAVGDRVRVHYYGWESSWDEVVAPGRVRVLGAGERVVHAPATTSAGDFGSLEATPFALEGRVYAVPVGTARLPDFASLSPVGTIFTRRLDVTPRSFLQGFPGVTERFEWFAIDYKGSFGIRQAGNYRFRLLSDDGARLLIDGRTVVDNDGLHGARAKEASVALSPGLHEIQVQYFQGPRAHVALVLELGRDGEPYRVFDTTRYAPTQIARDDAGNLRVTLAEGILFDTNQSELKPEAQRVLNELKGSLLDRQSFSALRVEGHTDDRGTDAHNLDLSERRAGAVASWLKARGVAGAKISARGFGKARPSVPNLDDASRAKNRRVEILVDRAEPARP